MTEQTSTETAADAVLKPFQWHDPELDRVPGVRFAGRALDLANGINCVLEILLKNSLEKDFGTTLLNDNQEGRLMGLVIAASQTLANESTTYLKWAEKHERDPAPASEDNGPVKPN